MKILSLHPGFSVKNAFSLFKYVYIGPFSRPFPEEKIQNYSIDCEMLMWRHITQRFESHYYFEAHNFCNDRIYPGRLRLEFTIKPFHPIDYIYIMIPPKNENKST